MRAGKLKWEFDDDGSFMAELAPYVLFVHPDGALASWWIGEDRGDGEDLVSVAEGEARTMAIAKADAEAAGWSLVECALNVPRQSPARPA